MAPKRLGAKVQPVCKKDNDDDDISDGRSIPRWRTATHLEAEVDVAGTYDGAEAGSDDETSDRELVRLLRSADDIRERQTGPDIVSEGMVDLLLVARMDDGVLLLIAVAGLRSLGRDRVLPGVFGGEDVVGVVPGVRRSTVEVAHLYACVLDRRNLGELRQLGRRGHPFGVHVEPSISEKIAALSTLKQLESRADEEVRAGGEKRERDFDYSSMLKERQDGNGSVRAKPCKHASSRTRFEASS